MEIPGGYKIIDTLGEGNLATVYLALGELVERELALKLVKPEVCSDTVFTESFLNRARLLSELEHPHIVSVFDAGQESGRCYLAMAYIAGRTLRHRRFELTLSEQLAVIRDVAGALDFAHSRGCDHGRLTPDNILIRDRDHSVIVTDFVMGRAPVMAAERDPHLSPEQRRGDEGDHRSDLYSLGIILLLLIGGELHEKAAHAESQADSSKDAAAADKPAIADMGATDWVLPDGLEVFQPILEQALAFNPEDRYQSGKALVSALDEIPEAQLERAARAGALALMSKADLDERSKEASAEALPPKEAVTETSGETATPIFEGTDSEEPQTDSDSSPVVEHSMDSYVLEEEPSDLGAELVESEADGGVLRVWEQDRIDHPLESEPPSWWLITSCGLAALILVGGVVLAAILD